MLDQPAVFLLKPLEGFHILGLVVQKGIALYDHQQLGYGVRGSDRILATLTAGFSTRRFLQRSRVLRRSQNLNRHLIKPFTQMPVTVPLGEAHQLSVSIW